MVTFKEIRNNLCFPDSLSINVLLTSEERLILRREFYSLHSLHVIGPFSIIDLTCFFSFPFNVNSAVQSPNWSPEEVYYSKNM
jgi:hypothetical protein